MREVEEKERKSNKTPAPFKRCALCDLLTLPRLSVSPTSTDSIIVTLTFSLTLSHTHTHTLWSVLCSGVDSLSVSVSDWPQKQESFAQTHTHSVDRSGKYLGWFPSECLGMFEECLPALVSSLFLLFPFLLALQGWGRAERQQRDNMPVFELADLDWVFPSIKMKIKQYLQLILLL